MIRTEAMPVRPWRLVGDMGIRCLWSHERALNSLLKTRKVDLIFIPGPPWFMFLLGPKIKKHFGISFVMDYIDPWTSAWSAAASFPSRTWAYHHLANFYEPKVLQATSYVTAVSEGILANLRQQYPFLSEERMTAMPYGGDVKDFEVMGQLKIGPPDFKSDDGYFNFCFTGALQPHGTKMLRALFKAVGMIRERYPDFFKKLRFRFYGTSNLTWGHGRYCVVPLAREFGIEGSVTEIPERIPYLQSLAVQVSAQANLVMGSSDRYYHASKLYPCLLAGKPIFAMCHEASSIVTVLSNLGVRGVVTFSDVDNLIANPENLVRQILTLGTQERLSAFSWERFEPYSAEGVTRTLAEVFEKAVQG